MPEEDDFLSRASCAVFVRMEEGASLFSLSWPEQVLVVVYTAQGLMETGGLQYLFENDWPEQPPYSTVADAYRAIGAEEAAECIEAGASLFPFPNPHRDAEARRAYLSEHHAGASTLPALNERVIAQSAGILDRLTEYVRSHNDQIQIPAEQPRVSDWQVWIWTKLYRIPYEVREDVSEEEEKQRMQMSCWFTTYPEPFEIVGEAPFPDISAGFLMDLGEIFENAMGELPPRERKLCRESFREIFGCEGDVGLPPERYEGGETPACFSPQFARAIVTAADSIPREMLREAIPGALNGDFKGSADDFLELLKEMLEPFREAASKGYGVILEAT